MKFVRKIIIILFTLIIIIGGVIITHITPSMSIRTYLFVTGHPIGAFKSTISINKGQYEMDKDILDNEHAMIYETDDFIVYDGGTGNPMSNFKVTKTWILYFAEIYGQA
ncbi:hypothetical protein LGL08_21635 [Clostridium estertheticum]|uniref:hypothetical protein n=1 Tax=Clostridium estertheticum TaxID=238834 RepID=UPI001CF1E2D5|nr:hypothetical protein [Clostridium estertheticum]MCB2309174.1 hypothetical protein [Clostridium estertheticum]MCB2347534.1 hypothetical protein [Clostridium estertheticum]MCB2352129.1 hypothetical protein [Clostridium estertheticum]WAG48295.1 hypothetical protein LL127_22605 [Clostridium estertheticum]